LICAGRVGYATTAPKMAVRLPHPSPVGIRKNMELPLKIALVAFCTDIKVIFVSEDISKLVSQSMTR
jgi:hypothetical protein